ncbi:MAG: DMT family transporter [Deltaproteobacteria bacterium]|nr:DMT family transporter [Deltaproteobacteria bacterium]
MPNSYQTKNYLDLKAIIILLILCTLWGGNMAAIKFSNKGLAPMFTAGLRSLVAAGLMYLWLRYRGERIFPPGLRKIHAVMVGVLFGLEFAFIYISQHYTLASRSYIFLYTHPFWVAWGAHYLIPGDQLTRRRFLGLLLAFGGLVFAFSEGLTRFSGSVLWGDFLVLLGALGWAATTLYVKLFLVRSCGAFQTLIYQLIFSAPVLFVLSFLLEGNPIRYVDWTIGISFFYQAVIVAWLSYWAWFYLMHIYPVTSLAAFSFITPISGVFISSLLLQEPLSLTLLVSLVLISLGIYWVNKR